MLIYMDGFDHYAAASGNGNRLYECSPSEWSHSATATNHGDTDTMPVLGTRALRLMWHATATGANDLRYLLPTTITSGTTLGFGTHIYMSTLPDTAAKGGIFGFGSASGFSSRTLRVNTGGTLSFVTGTIQTGSALGTSTSTLSAAVLYHVEMKILFHASAGEVEVRVNGVPYLTLTGIDTMPSATTHLLLGATGRTASAQDNSNYIYYDNLFIWDTSGPRINDFLGERTIQTLFPDADTGVADWALSSGSDGYALIDNLPANGGTDYIEASAPGDESVFGMANLTATNIAPTAVQVNLNASKTSAGAVSVQFGPRTNGVDDLSPGSNLTQSQFLYFHHITEVNPDTGLAWTPAELNALEIKVSRSV